MGAIDREFFAEECVLQGVYFRIEPHYLLAVSRSSVPAFPAIRQRPQGSVPADAGGVGRQHQQRRIRCSFHACSDHQHAKTMRGLRLDGTSRLRCLRIGAKSQSQRARALSPAMARRFYTDASADFQKALDSTPPFSVPPPMPCSTIRKPRRRQYQDARHQQPAATDNPGRPEWYRLALIEIGKPEVGHTNNGPVITRYMLLAQCGQPGHPWCAIFVNAMFAPCASPAVAGTRSPSSQSFRSSDKFVHLGGPALGAVTVFWRGSPDSGQGHVGFYNGETAESIYVLGGNEDNRVEIAPVKRCSSSAIGGPPVSPSLRSPRSPCRPARQGKRR